MGLGNNIDILLRLRGARAAAGDMNKVGTSGDQMGQKVDKAGQKATGAAKRFAGLRKITNMTSTAMGGAAKTALGLVAAYAGVAAAKKAVTATVDLGKAALGLNRNLGLTIGQGSEWGAVAKSRGIDNKALTMSFTKLSSAVEKGRAGSEAQVDLFKSLGVSQKELGDGSTNLQGILFKAADGFGAMEGGTKRQAAAQALLGRGYQTILPLFSKGADGLREQLALARKYGATLSGSTSEQISEFIGKQRESKLAMMGLQILFTTQVLPSLIKLISVVVQGAAAFQKLPAPIKLVALALVALGAAFLGPMGWLVAAGIVAILIANNWGKIAPVFDLVKGKVTGALAAIKPQVASLIVAFKGAMPAIRNIGIAFQWVFLHVVLPVVRRAMPGVVQMVRGALKILTGVVMVFSGIFTGDFRKIWAGIKMIFRGGTQYILGSIRAVTAPLRHAAAAAAGGIAAVFSKAWENVKKAFKDSINWVIGVWNGLHFKIPGFDPPGPGPKFGGITIGLNHIPELAMGGIARTGGLSIVGDDGPELLNIPQAASITPLTQAGSNLPDPWLSKSDLGGVHISKVYLDKKLIAEAVADYAGDKKARG